MSTDAEIKAQALNAGRALDLMSVAGRNRKDRRRLAKINGLDKIAGTRMPYVNKQKAKENGAG